MVSTVNKIKVAAIQFDIAWLNKAKNLQKLDALINQNVTPSSIDLLLLPETFSTGFSIRESGCEEPEQGGIVLTWMKNKAKILNCAVCGSVLVESPIARSEQTGHSGPPKKLNRFYWCFPDGNVLHYDKRHLFRLGNEQDYVVAGEERLVDGQLVEEVDVAGLNTDASGAAIPGDTIGQVQFETIPWEDRADRPDLDGDLIIAELGRQASLLLIHGCADGGI